MPSEETPPNSERQKGDTKQFPYCGTTNIRRHVTKVSRPGLLTQVTCTSLYKRLHIQVKSTVKLSLCLIQHCAMTYEGNDVYHLALTSVLDGDEESVSRHGRFNLDK
jgi:transposase-like protein